MSDPDALPHVPAPEARQRALGHDKARAAINSQIAAKRLPGAILLHGPQGIGKASFAFEMAAAILTATGDEPAGRVSEQVAALSHPNLFVLRRRPKDAKGFYTVIRVEDVREIRDSLHHTRGRAGYRVAIIDPIDDCNPSAANALLKTLEEPPADTTFLLISHRPGRLLPTIKSRCHNLALRPIKAGDVRTILLEYDPALAAEDLDRAVALSGGRPRRAFETLSLEAASALGALQAWLQNPVQHPSGAALQLADALGASTQSTELSFAREMLDDWIADEARAAAINGENRMRLASANELWDKAHALFADADDINLDMKQTLVAVFDAIRKHAALTIQSPAENP
ncbi:AAA family ATPase [Devosia submarina]|uniref:AAA family ATPase n=1 Tax=Devosia submarina TaxID=1173082 RepID=UPI0013006C6B|nr:AAA family ATPase [Devosia submarina]